MYAACTQHSAYRFSYFVHLWPQIIVEGGWRNKIALPWMDALGVPVMRTWNETVPLWSYHHHYHPYNPHPDCGSPQALPDVARMMVQP